MSSLRGARCSINDCGTERSLGRVRILLQVGYQVLDSFSGQQSGQGSGPTLFFRSVLQRPIPHMAPHGELSYPVLEKGIPKLLRLSLDLLDHLLTRLHQRFYAAATLRIPIRERRAFGNCLASTFASCEWCMIRCGVTPAVAMRVVSLDPKLLTTVGLTVLLEAPSGRYHRA
jgi:hypothetical protein